MASPARISARTKVWLVIQTWPETVPVFLGRGCPEMRTGFFSAMARIMSVRTAARIHRIPLEQLLVDLNDVANRSDASSPSMPAGEDARDQELTS